MIIHRIEISEELIAQLFISGEKHYKIENGLSPDAKIIGFGRIPKTNTYEALFEAKSGVEIRDGDVIITQNPLFIDLRK